MGKQDVVLLMFSSSGNVREFVIALYSMNCTVSLGEGENGGLLKGDLPWMQRIFDLRCAKHWQHGKK